MNDTNYGTGFTRRGNLTSSRAMQDSWGCKSYETTGNLLTSFGPSQPTVNVTPSAARNNAVPQAMSVGGLTTTFDWNGLLQLTGSTAPNNARTLISYDSNARPATTTTPTGATATMTYTVNTTTSTVNGRSTVTTIDGFGRSKKVEAKDSGGVLVSTVETEYESCACTPFGSWSVDGGDGVDDLRV